MTLRYAHLSPAHRKEAVAVLDCYADTGPIASDKQVS